MTMVGPREEAAQDDGIWDSHWGDGLHSLLEFAPEVESLGLPLREAEMGGRRLVRGQAHYVAEQRALPRRYIRPCVRARDRD